MGKLVDYPCRYSEFKGLLTSDPQPLGLKVPDLYQNADDMVSMVLAQKKEHGSVCRLPLDTIALAENLGASVIYDTSSTGPRKKDDVLTSTGQVLELPAADPDKGRMGQIMQGLQKLAEHGEIPVYSTRGLFDTLNFLIDIQKVIMDFSMDPSVMQQVSDRIRSDILTTCLAAEKAGARMITYSDGSGSLSVLGPKFVKRVVKTFLYPLMQDLDAHLAADTVIQMCPKTSFMLTGCDKAEFVTKETLEPTGSLLKNFLEDPDIRFAGSVCNRDIGEPAGQKITYLKLLCSQT